MRKNFLMVSMADFHSRDKRWQGGDVEHVKVKVCGGKSLTQVMRLVGRNEAEPYMVFSLDKTGNITSGEGGAG